MIPCQLRPTSPTECGENEEGDDAATEAPTMMENETVVDPNEMEKNWYASRMQEVEGRVGGGEGGDGRSEGGEKGSGGGEKVNRGGEKGNGGGEKG